MSKLATYLSHWMDVTTYRDGQYEHVLFKEGVLERRDGGKLEDFGSGWQDLPQHGTYVIWEPSEEFFTHTEADVNELRNLFNTIANFLFRVLPL